MLHTLHVHLRTYIQEVNTLEIRATRPRRFVSTSPFSDAVMLHFSSITSLVNLHRLALILSFAIPCLKALIGSKLTLHRDGWLAE